MSVITVSSTLQLYEALANVKAGDTIALAPGDYGRVALWQNSGFDPNFPENVTITSLDHDRPAIIRELGLTNVSNLTFDGLIFDYDAEPGQSYKDRPFTINHSQNIVIRNSVFDGDLAEGLGPESDGFPTGIALSVRRSQDVTIEDNEFFSFYKALGFGGGSGYVARGNDIHTIRVDGITVTKSSDVLIEENHFHDFHRSLGATDHSDMIQFWTTRAREPMTDLVIRNNLLNIGEGGHSQGIFLGNEAAGARGHGADMFYQRMEISGNVIINAHSNGLVVGGANDLLITNNILLHDDGGSPRDAGHLEMPRIRVAQESTNVTITDNVAYSVPNGMDEDGAPRPDWTLSGNRLVQNLNPDAEGYYDAAGTFLTAQNISLDFALRDAASWPGAAPSVFVTDLVSMGYHADFDTLVFVDEALRRSADYDAASETFLFDGQRGSVALGRLNEYRDTPEITVEVRYTLDTEAPSGHLFNNHLRMNMSFGNDSLVLRVATRDDGYRTYDIEGIDHVAGVEQELRVSLDREADILQVHLNGETVLEDRETDFIDRADLFNWGWTLGHHWQRSFDGEIAGFALHDEALLF